MPFYEYFCQDCNKRFEIKATMAEKEKGLKTNCLVCGSKKTVRILGNFFTAHKGNGGSSGGCGHKPTPGCCG